MKFFLFLARASVVVIGIKWNSKDFERRIVVFFFSSRHYFNQCDRGAGMRIQVFSLVRENFLAAAYLANSWPAVNLINRNVAPPFLGMCASCMCTDCLRIVNWQSIGTSSRLWWVQIHGVSDRINCSKLQMQRHSMRLSNEFCFDHWMHSAHEHNGWPNERAWFD